MGARVERLTSDNEADFFRLHGDPDRAGWCWCVAWWTDSWEVLRPSARSAGLATLLLRGVIADLDGRGVSAEQGYPRRWDLPAEDVWTGTEETFVSAGFRCVRDDPRRPVFQRG